MKNIYAVILLFFSSLSYSYCSWEPGYWNPNASQTSSQTTLLTSNIWYLQSAKQYDDITSNKQYDVCVLFYENNEMDQVIDQVARSFTAVIFLKVNVNKFPVFKEELETVPAICLYKSGGIVYFQYGKQTAQELTTVLKKYLKKRERY